MNTAEKIFDEVKALPEIEAKEVLDFVGYLKTKREQSPPAFRTMQVDHLIMPTRDERHER